jgi:CRISPR/Cas system-associated exonuclease Cas4 (RecB family)
VQTALMCPRLFHYRYVEKLKEPEAMPEARVGKAIHAALEQVLLGTPLFDAVAEARQALDTERETARFDVIGAGIQPFVERVDRFRRRRRVNRQLIEYPLAIREDLTTTTFYARDALYRGILDVGFIFDDDNLALVDHKSGQRAGQRTIAEQLEGYAVLAAACFRSIRRIWLGIYWVASAELEWDRPVQSSDINQYFLPNVLSNIEAAALAVDDGPRPNPGSWCERCNYRSVCPVGKELRFEPVDDEEPEPWM